MFAQSTPVALSNVGEATSTANLASFLVSPQINVFRISSIDDALKHNAVICVQKNAVIQTILANRYPTLNVLPKETETEIYSSLRLPIEKGGCHAAAHQFNTYDIYPVLTGNANYSTTVVNGTLTVGQRAITVTIGNAGAT